MIVVAFLNPNIPPRAVALLNRINKNKKVKIYGIFFAVAQQNRRWKINSKEYEKINFSYTILKSLSLGFGIKDFHNTYLSAGLFKTLKKVNPDIIVIPGWADITSLLALVWGKLNRKKIILRTESTAREKSWRRTLFYPVTWFTLVFSDLIIGSSRAAKKYAQSFKIKTKSTHILSSFNTRSFAKKVNLQRKKKVELKKSLSISQKQSVYFNGQLIERKGVKQLLKSFSQPNLKKIALIISGYGPLEDLVKNYANKYSNIYFLGFAKQTDLPKYYALTDIFILPSFEETWGLVVIEGLAAGLPIITSQFVGASEIITKKRGEIINVISVKEISKATKKIFSQKYKKMGKENQKYALEDLNFEKIAQKFIKVFTTD